MELIFSLDDPTVAFVKKLLPSVVVEPDTEPEPGVDGPSYHIHLPLPAGAEYRFTLWVGGGEKQITARLLTADQTAHFWYLPFEEADFHTGEQLNKAFLDAVEQIACHNTRIEQKRGLFANHFRCEYESASGWKRVSGISALRWIRVPRMPGRRQVYQSPPLVPDV